MPLVSSTPLHKTFLSIFRYAEMPKETKNEISHRRRALNKLKAYLEENIHLLAASEDDQLAGEKKSKVDPEEATP